MGRSQQLVPIPGLEPGLLSETDFESVASTNFARRARLMVTTSFFSRIVRLSYARIPIVRTFYFVICYYHLVPQDGFEPPSPTVQVGALLSKLLWDKHFLPELQPRSNQCWSSSFLIFLAVMPSFIQHVPN